MRAVRFGAAALGITVLAWTAALTGCQDQGSAPVTMPPVVCDDPDSVVLSGFTPTAHNQPLRLRGALDTLAGVKWADGDSVKAFFGGREMKLVFTLHQNMYMVTYAGGTPTVTRLSHGDEGIFGGQGAINSPLFSPDGKRITYAGTPRGKPAFIQEALVGAAEGWRVPLDPFRVHVTSDPHWHTQGGKTWIYFSTLANLLQYDDQCQRIPGDTYRKEIIGDTGIGPFEPTGIPGAYRGGISKDGEWAGTSYATSTLFNLVDKSTRILSDGVQQCNPSMNPFEPGSKHMDYMMILAFGGTTYHLVDGKDFMEGLHENLWIYNHDDKIVWRARRPDTTVYQQWDKPEWSTDPQFATAIAMYPDGETGDLYVVKVGDLANAATDTLAQAQGFLKIGAGGFNSDVFTHLWVDPAAPADTAKAP